MFISCTRVLVGLPWSLVMSSSRLDSKQNGQYAVTAPSGVPRGDAQDARASPLPPLCIPPLAMCIPPSPA